MQARFANRVLSQPTDYGSCQRLRTLLPENRIGAFSCPSARNVGRHLNGALLAV